VAHHPAITRSVLLFTWPEIRERTGVSTGTRGMRAGGAISSAFNNDILQTY
jgi:hypothetical protein